MCFVEWFLFEMHLNSTACPHTCLDWIRGFRWTFCKLLVNLCFTLSGNCWNIIMMWHVKVSYFPRSVMSVVHCCWGLSFLKTSATQSFPVLENWVHYSFWSIFFLYVLPVLSRNCQTGLQKFMWIYPKLCNTPLTVAECF